MLYAMIVLLTLVYAGCDEKESECDGVCDYSLGWTPISSHECESCFIGPCDRAWTCRLCTCTCDGGTAISGSACLYAAGGEACSSCHDGYLEQGEQPMTCKQLDCSYFTECEHDNQHLGAEVKCESSCNTNTCCKEEIYCDSHACPPGYNEKTNANAVSCGAECDNSVCCDEVECDDFLYYDGDTHCSTYESDVQVLGVADDLLKGWIAWTEKKSEHYLFQESSYSDGYEIIDLEEGFVARMPKFVKHQQSTVTTGTTTSSGYSSFSAYYNADSTKKTDEWGVQADAVIASVPINVNAMGSHSETRSYAEDHQEQKNQFVNTYEHRSTNMELSKKEGTWGVNQVFLDAVESLSEWPEAPSDSIVREYRNFFETWGSHYLTTIYAGFGIEAINVGGTCIEGNRVDSSSSTADCFGAGISANFVSFESKTCKEQSSANSAASLLSSTFTNSFYQLTGGSPNDQRLASNVLESAEKQTEVMNNWKRSGALMPAKQNFDAKGIWLVSGISQAKVQDIEKGFEYVLNSKGRSADALCESRVSVGCVSTDAADLKITCGSDALSIFVLTMVGFLVLL